MQGKTHKNEVNGLTDYSLLGDRTCSVSPSRLIAFAATVLIIASGSQNAKAQTTITEAGLKVTLQNGTLAYIPQGTYTLAAGEVLHSVNQKLYEDINNNNNWTVVTNQADMATVNGNWTYPSGSINPMVAGRKHRTECNLKYFNRNNPNIILSVGIIKDFNYCV